MNAVHAAQLNIRPRGCHWMCPTLKEGRGKRHSWGVPTVLLWMSTMRS